MTFTKIHVLVCMTSKHKNYCNIWMIKPEIEIETVEDAKKYGVMIICGRRPGILRFQSSITKQYFFSLIKQYIPDVNIINCDSSEDRFENDIKHLHENDVVVFDNIHKCPHFSSHDHLSMKNTFKNMSKNILIW